MDLIIIFVLFETSTNGSLISLEQIFIIDAAYFTGPGLLSKKRASDRKSWLETKGNLANV